MAKYVLFDTETTGGNEEEMSKLGWKVNDIESSEHTNVVGIA